MDYTLLAGGITMLLAVIGLAIFKLLPELDFSVSNPNISLSYNEEFEKYRSRIYGYIPSDEYLPCEPENAEGYDEVKIFEKPSCPESPHHRSGEIKQDNPIALCPDSTGSEIRNETNTITVPENLQEQTETKIDVLLEQACRERHFSIKDIANIPFDPQNHEKYIAAIRNDYLKNEPEDLYYGIKDSNEYVRACALMRVTLEGKMNILPELLLALKDPSPHVRMTAERCISISKQSLAA